MKLGWLTRSTKKIVKVRSFGGFGVNNIYLKLDALLKKKPSKIVLHLGTNHTVMKTSQRILDDILKLKQIIESTIESIIDLDPKTELPTKLKPNAQNFVPSNVNFQITRSAIPGNVFVPSTKNYGESCKENYSALNATLNMQNVSTLFCNCNCNYISCSGL